MFFLILNGHLDAINRREAAEEFNNAVLDLQTMTLDSFRSAMAVTYDREAFAAAVSPANFGAYGVIGEAYICDPDTGLRYRDTAQAKQVLCDYYGVDVTEFASLDEAVESITGCDVELAKELYRQAFADALAAGYITDTDGDGISDQTVQIEYAISFDSNSATRIVAGLNEQLAVATKGTPFEGKIRFVKSAPYGFDWSNKIRNGQTDAILGGWSGRVMDSFSLTDMYVHPTYMYDAWYDAEESMLTLTIGGEEITMNVRQWSDALNGEQVGSYNFGKGQASLDTRLTILAAIESEILSRGTYIPALQDSAVHLLSRQLSYVTDEYSAIMGWGGLAYLQYKYTDEQWAAYVESCGGTVDYTAPEEEWMLELTASANGDGKPALVWAETADALCYEVFRGESGEEGYVKLVEVNGTSYDDYTAREGVSYRYRVRAVLEDGTYILSASRTVLCPVVHVDSGVCGDDLEWTLSREGTLTIEGTGDMWDYSPSSPAPWMTYAAQITAIVVGDGVTSVGAYAFSGLDGVLPQTAAVMASRTARRTVTVTLGKSVASVGENAFYGSEVVESVFFTGDAPQLADNALPEEAAIYYDEGTEGWDEVDGAEAAEPPTVSVANGASASLGDRVTLTAAVSGTPAPSVQWQFSTDGIYWEPVAGADNPELTMDRATLAQQGLYRCVVTGQTGTAISDAVGLQLSGVNLAVEKSLSDGQLSANVLVENAEAYGLEGTVLCAVYASSGQLLEIQTLPLAVLAETSGGLPFRFDTDAAEIHTVRAYYVSTEGWEPLCDFANCE